MLQDHLPWRYQAESAFVIDAAGTQSDQIDIVLYDRQYTPVLYNRAGQKIIPAEGVYAVFEVKPQHDASNVQYAAEKIASVRRLKRTSATIVHAGGEHKPRPLTPIVGGLLTTAPGWFPVFGDPFLARLQSLPADQRLDLGCVASAGGFEVIYDAGKVCVSFGPPDQALAFFFIRLLHRLQRLGTVPAIDYHAYLAALN
jgi:hypothetical protein